MDFSVVRIERIPGDALRWNRTASYWKRIRKLEQRRARGDGVEELLGQLEGTAGVVEWELAEEFVVYPVPASDHGPVIQPVCRAQARDEIPLIRTGRNVTRRDSNVFRIQRADAAYCAL